jgi:hypothetical protein
MRESLENNSSENLGRDVSAEFMDGASSFNRFINTLSNELSLKIELDLANLTDRMEFILLARRAKGFLEIKPLEQSREASIRCTKEQMRWDSNAFASGVEWLDSDKG